MTRYQFTVTVDVPDARTEHETYEVVRSALAVEIHKNDKSYLDVSAGQPVAPTVS